MPRAKTPIEILKRRGTARPDQIRAAEQTLKLTPDGVGAAPEWFTPAMLAEWKRISNHPELKLVLSSADRAVVEHYCVLHERMVLDVKGERHMTASERQTYHATLTQLGWTPASRSRVAAPKAPAAADDPWAKF